MVYSFILIHLAGKKSYCCKNDNNGAFVPPAFSQCFWGVELRKEMSIAQRCEAYCPPNYLKIAVDSGHCAGEDKMALCCHGYNPSDLPDHLDPVPPGTLPGLSEKALEFRHNLGEYVYKYKNE